MRQSARSAGGWFAAAFLCAGAFWACSGSDTNPFGKGKREPSGTSGTSGTSGASGGGTGGSSAGTTSGNSGSGGTSGASGASTGGEATGGMTTGGTTGDGGESGDDTGGSTTGGSAGMGGAGMGGNAGTPAVGGAGMSGSPMGGAGANAGAGMGNAGAGTSGGGMSGTGGMPGDCKEDTDCNDDEYCKKASCDAESGHCQERGPECLADDAEFDPICGCDGITYWNTCVIEHEGFNVAMAGECTGNNRPTCTRTGGGDSCPPRQHAHCYRPVEVCGDPSPMNGVCWVLPTECPDNEPQTERYCGGTGGEQRCIGLCEVIDDENSFRRDAPVCD